MHHGTMAVTLLAGIDLLTGKVHALVRDRCGEARWRLRRQAHTELLHQELSVGIQLGVQRQD